MSEQEESNTCEDTGLGDSEHQGETEGEERQEEEVSLLRNKEGKCKTYRIQRKTYY